MKNVFLLGNGFDLHHKLPTKYFDFMCVVDYLGNNRLTFPITIGDVLSNCTESQNIIDCYAAHKEVFDTVEVPSATVNEISHLLLNNIWFDYFLKTLNRDLGWIDFEKEIFNVITILDEIIDPDEKSVYLPQHELLPPFILSNFNFFVDVWDDAKLYPGDDLDILKKYLIEYPYNSGIYVADKKKIFDELYEKLLDFNKALNLYFEGFIENAFYLLHKDNFMRNSRIDLINMADNAVSFNYTSTLEELYFNKKAYHIHGRIKDKKMVLGVNPNEADDMGTNDTSLIKFKKYYQREFLGTDIEYINWYRDILSAKTEYRVIVIGHSLDETDKDIISDMFLNAKEIYITYFNDECKDGYVANIVKMFGKSGFDKFRREQHMEFVLLSKIASLKSKIEPQQIDRAFSDSEQGEKIVVI